MGKGTANIKFEDGMAVKKERVAEYFGVLIDKEGAII